MRPYFVAIALTIVFSGGMACAQEPTTSEGSPPLSVSDIEHGLKAGVTNTRMEVLVKQYGVDFGLTDAVEKELRAAGANGDLLLAISRTKASGRTSEKDHSAEPKPTNPPPATQTHASTGARDSVDLFFRVRPGIGYLHIAQFNETTDKEVQDALDSFYQSGELKGLILDLRQSSGGLPKEAVGVADNFLHKGQPIVPDHGCSSSESRYTAMRGNGGKDYPLVVLIDGGTASAAELVAGTIQDHDRGLVAGETTHSFDVAANREVKLTDGGRTVYCGGITPDVRIDPARSNSFQNTSLQHQVETDPDVLRALDLLPMAQALMQNAKKISAEQNSAGMSARQSNAPPNGSVRGMCKDASGKPYVDARVEWVSLDTGQKYVLKTNNNGAYFALGIKPGMYRVTLLQNAQEVENFDNVHVAVDGANLDFDTQTTQSGASQLTSFSAQNQIDDACLSAAISQSAAAHRQTEVTDHYNKGAQLHNSQNLSGGATEFGLAILADPLNALAYYYRGIDLLGLSVVTPAGKILASPETIGCFQMYLALSPGGPQASAAQQILGSLNAPVSSSAVTRRVADIRSSVPPAAAVQNQASTDAGAHDCVTRGVTPAPPGDHWPVVALQNVCSKAIAISFCWLVDDLPDNGWGCWESRIDAGKSTSYNEMDEAKMSCIEGHYPGTVSPDPSCSHFKIIWNATYQDSGQRPQRPNVPRNPNQTAR